MSPKFVPKGSVDNKSALDWRYSVFLRRLFICSVYIYIYIYIYMDAFTVVYQPYIMSISIRLQLKFDLSYLIFLKYV